MRISSSTLFCIHNILDRKTKNGRKTVLVQWQGWPHQFDSWLPTKEVIKLQKIKDNGSTIECVSWHLPGQHQLKLYHNAVTAYRITRALWGGISWDNVQAWNNIVSTEDYFDLIEHDCSHNPLVYLKILTGNYASVNLLVRKMNALFKTLKIDLFFFVFLQFYKQKGFYIRKRGIPTADRPSSKYPCDINGGQYNFFCLYRYCGSPACRRLHCSTFKNH